MSIISSMLTFALKIALIILVGFGIAKVIQLLLDEGKLPNKMVPSIVTRPAVWISFLGVAMLGFKFLLVLLVPLALDVLAAMDGGGTRVGRRTTLLIAAVLRRLDALLDTHTEVETDKLNLYATRLELSQAYHDGAEEGTETESLLASLRHGVQIGIRRILNIDIDEITSDDVETKHVETKTVRPGDVNPDDVEADTLKSGTLKNAVLGGVIVLVVAFGATVLIAGLGGIGDTNTDTPDEQDDMGTPPADEQGDTITADDVEITIERNEFGNESSGDTGVVILEFDPYNAEQFRGSNLRWEAQSFTEGGSDTGRIAPGEQAAVPVTYYTEKTSEVTVFYEDRPIYIIATKGYTEDGEAPLESNDVVVLTPDREIVQD